MQGPFTDFKPKKQHLEGQPDKTPLNSKGVFTQCKPTKQHLNVQEQLVRKTPNVPMLAIPHTNAKFTDWCSSPVRVCVKSDGN